MAKLPGYDSKQGMTVEPGAVKRDPASEAQFGKDLQVVGKAAQEISAVWQKAKDFKETLAEKNRIDIGTQGIMEEMKSDNDPENRQKYEDKLDELYSGGGQFSSNDAARKFKLYSDQARNRATILMDNAYNKKDLDFSNANIITQGEVNHQLHISGQKTADGLDPLAVQKAIIDKAFTDGTTGYEITAKREKALEDWDYDRAIFDAQNGQFKGFDAYELKSGKQDDLAREIKQIARINAEMMDVESLKAQATNQQEYLKQEEQMTLANKLEILDRAIETNSMDEGWAKSRRAAVLSAAGVDPEDQLDYFYEVVQLINRANAKYNIKASGKNARNYIKQANVALIKINDGIAKGLVSRKSEKELLKRVYTKDMAEAEQDSGGALRKATESFENSLSPDEVPYAIKEWFDEVETSGGPKGKDLIDVVNRKIKSQSREMAIKIRDDVANTEALDKKETKIINGITYEKVKGGWLPAQK